MAKPDIEGAIAVALRARIPELSQKVWAHQTPSNPSYPYAVVIPVTQTAEYSSQGPISTGDLSQVSLYARNAADANRLAIEIDEALTFRDLDLTDTGLARIWRTQTVSIDPKPGTSAGDAYQRLITFRSIRSARRD